MKLFPFALTCAMVLPLTPFAEEIVREGDIYATVKLDAEGDMQVVDLHTDLPAHVHPEIENWLEQQTVVLPDADVDPDAHRVVEVRYQVIEADDATQSLAMGITDTNATLPEAASKGIPVQVSVRVREDGTVASVEPQSDLPPGVRVADLEQAVADSIENDPAITQAAASGRLSDSTQTITVIIKQPEN